MSWAILNASLVACTHLKEVATVAASHTLLEICKGTALSTS